MAMRRFPSRRIAVPAAVLLLALFSAFFLRAPVVVVTDAPFETLYGARRASFRRLSASLSLFRAVRPALLVPDAAPEAVVQAVAAVSGAPRAVLFPHRYRRQALSYADAYPQVPSAVVGGPSAGNPEGSFPVFVFADPAADLYAAGRAAAGLGGARALGSAASGRALLAGPALGEVPAASFARGLADGGAALPPLLSESARIPPGENISCLVLLPGAADADSLPADLPLILFSWVDPRYAPPQTVLMMDDSVYGLLEGAAAAAVKGAAAASHRSRAWRRGKNLAFPSFFAAAADK